MRIEIDHADGIRASRGIELVAEREVTGPGDLVTAAEPDHETAARHCGRGGGGIVLLRGFERVALATDVAQIVHGPDVVRGEIRQRAPKRRRSFRSPGPSRAPRDAGIAGETLQGHGRDIGSARTDDLVPPNRRRTVGGIRATGPDPVRRTFDHGRSSGPGA